jgi:hypothetical protein
MLMTGADSAAEDTLIQLRKMHAKVTYAHMQSMKSGIEKLQQELETQQALFKTTEESLKKDLEATADMYSNTKTKVDQLQVCMIVNVL